MELRVLRYFLTVAQEGNITTAASRLHVTQPTLSRQIRDLEHELGQELLVRHSHSVSLTDAGTLLYERAQDVVGLADQIAEEFRTFGSDVEGDVYFGCAETREMRLVAHAIKRMQEKFPRIMIHMTSGNAADLCSHLDNGTLDFALLSQPLNLNRYETLDFPRPNYWCVYTRADNPLAELTAVGPADLVGQPLIVSSQSMRAIAGNAVVEWYGDLLREMCVVADFNLPFNGAVLAQEGVGSVVTWDGLIECGEKTGLVCRPLVPRIESHLSLAWRKNATFSQAAQQFLEYFREELEAT